MYTGISSAGWRRLAAALLLAFLFKAVIPAGYMPAAGGSFPPAMTLCVAGLPAGVIKTLALDHADQSPEPQALHCAFASVAGQSVLLHTPMAALQGLLYAMHLQPPRRSRFDFPSLVRGPPLGARAPPV